MSNINRNVDIRPFPVNELGEPVGHIPWWLAELAYKSYSKQYGTRQSLQRLYERGGFGRTELMYLLLGKWINPDTGEQNELQSGK